MPNPPPTLKPREVVAALHKLGFDTVRQKGAHAQLRHSDGRGTTVPIHHGRDISPRLLRRIAKDVGVHVEQLAAARR